MSDDLVKQPALRRWQESVYGKGPYQVPDYESMAAIVQEHESMADRIEELRVAIEKALDIALEECPYREGSGSYNDWWYDRKVLIEKLRGKL